METETTTHTPGGEASLAQPHLPSLFRGRGDYAIDDKGRLTLPPHMRRALADGGSLAVLDGKAVLWTEETYRAAVDHLNHLVAEQQLSQRDVRGFLSNTHPVNPDTQGRIVVPHAVRVEAGLEREVVVLGAGSRIEIVPAGADALEGLLGVDDSIVDALDRANF